MSLELIHPDWPLNEKVCAFTTTRDGGSSYTPYDSLNLALHVNDQSQHVLKNREILNQQMDFKSSPKWLKQTHSSIVVDAGRIQADSVEADASFTTSKNEICAVLTADCLPVLFSDRHGECVGVAHAGWQGLVKGILQQTIDAMSAYIKPEFAWLGPAIGPASFEVGEEVREAYLKCNSEYRKAFKAKQPGKWDLDIYKAAKIVLAAADITHVYGGTYCTYRDEKRFFSYRRNQNTGRMATIIMRK